MKALYKGLLVTGALSVVGIAIIIGWFIGFSAPLADDHRRHASTASTCSSARWSAWR